MKEDKTSEKIKVLSIEQEFQVRDSEYWIRTGQRYYGETQIAEVVEVILEDKINELVEAVNKLSK